MSIIKTEDSITIDGPEYKNLIYIAGVCGNPDRTIDAIYSLECILDMLTIRYSDKEQEEFDNNIYDRDTFDALLNKYITEV